MEEQVTAESTSVDSSVSESPADAQVESTNVSEPEQVQQSTDSHVDIGWKYGEEESENPAIPDTDEDIDGMLNDPSLDQERVPGVVQALRDARTQYRQLKSESVQLREQLTQLEQFGGIEGVNQTMGLIGSLVASPEQGAMPFLQTLYDQAYPAYEQIVHNAIQADPEFAINYLQQIGRLPKEIKQTAQLDSDTLAKIPEHLREVAKSLPANVMDDLMYQDESVRNHNLERELKLSQLDETQRQQAEQQWQGQVSQAQQSAQQSIETLSNQYEQAHYNELSKWQPYGPDSKDANSRVHKEIVEGALAELLDDQKFQQMYIDASALLRNAPMRRLHGESFAADQDERKARGLAAQFNTRLGQFIRERVKERDSIFRDARAWREQQRQPNRTEIGGVSSPVSNGKGPQTLTKEGRISSEYIDFIAESIKGA